MSSNLPPGVTDSMIPGNRPEDAWWEQFTEGIEVPTVLEQYDPKVLAALCNALFERIEGMLREAFRAGIAEQRVEEGLRHAD